MPQPKPPLGEPVAIHIKPERTKIKTNQSPQTSVRDQADKKETMAKQRSLSSENEKDDQCFVRNSSFLSRDIEQKSKIETFDKGKESPPKNTSPRRKVISPPKRNISLKKEPSIDSPSEVLPLLKAETPPKVMSPPKTESPPKVKTTATFTLNKNNTNINENSVAARASKIEATTSLPASNVTTPPVSTLKPNKANSKLEEQNAPKPPTRENSLGKQTLIKNEALSPVQDNAESNKTNDIVNSNLKDNNKTNSDESGRVGDKIKKFEKVAEDASGSATLGRLSRPGSVRGRSRIERLGSDSKDDFPPPATPFKDNVHFELSAGPKNDNANYSAEKQILNKNPIQNAVLNKWQRSESHEEKIQKPEPQKIIKPEFKHMQSPVDVTIRSPSLSGKIPDQFPSQGTAFRNVASPDQARNTHRFNEDVNTQNNIKSCKLKAKKEYSVSKGSSYFTRGSEEIWLVKKKDIEEIEERVLDSFRRAGGNMCMRSESMRPSSDSGQSVSFSHATMGRNKRQMYSRSESLDPQWAGARAQTLKRQTSVACTCGHDKKPRAKSAGGDTTPRPRSRSHGDDNNQGQHVLDKYETLV